MIGDEDKSFVADAGDLSIPLLFLVLFFFWLVFSWEEEENDEENGRT